MSDDLVLTCDEVAARLKVSRRTLDNMRKRDDFPRPLKLGTGRPRYLADEINAWTRAQAVEA